MIFRHFSPRAGLIFRLIAGLGVLAMSSGCIIWPVIYSRSEFSPSPAVTYESGDILASVNSRWFIPVTLLVSPEGPRANSPIPVGLDNWDYYRKIPGGFKFVASYKANYGYYHYEVGYLSDSHTLLVYNGETMLNATSGKTFALKGTLLGALSKFSLIKCPDGKMVEFNALTGESTDLQPAAAEFVRTN